MLFRVNNSFVQAPKALVHAPKALLSSIGISIFSRRDVKYVCLACLISYWYFFWTSRTFWCLVGFWPRWTHLRYTLELRLLAVLRDLVIHGASLSLHVIVLLEILVDITPKKHQ